MKLLLHCPSCSRAIADLHPTLQQVTCPNCREHYGIIYGKLSRRSSVYEALLYLTRKLPSFYKRHYTFQITTPYRTLKRLQFSIPGKLDEVPVCTGDIVSVFYTMRGYVMRHLVGITNHTTGKRYILPIAAPSSSYRLMRAALLAIGLTAIAVFTGAGVWLAATASSLSLLLYLKLSQVAYLTTPPLTPSQPESRRLMADQQLIARKHQIEQRLTELDHETRANHVLIHQIEELQQRMQQVDAQLYSARLYRASTAVNILKRQITNNQRLVREYTHARKMIDIEVDTSWIADQLPEVENFTRTIFERLDELKTIEEQNEDLKSQLTAYAEVNHPGSHGYDRSVLPEQS